MEGSLALLRRAREADPDYFPAQQEYVLGMRTFGEIDALRRDYPAVDDGDPDAACLSIVAGAPRGMEMAAVQEVTRLERERGPTPCGAAYLGEYSALLFPEDRGVSSLDHGQRAARAAPENWRTWVHLSGAWGRAGRQDESARVLVEGAQQAPHALPRVHLLVALAQSGSLDDPLREELIAALEAAVARDGRPGLRLAYLLSLPGQASPGTERHRRLFDRAQGEIAEILRGAPGWRERWYATFELGRQALDQLGDPSTALLHVRAADASAEGRGSPALRMETRVRWGRVLAKLGRLDEAERVLLAAIAMGEAAGAPYHLADAWHNLAHVHEGRDELDAAAFAADRFVRNADSLIGVPIRVIAWRDYGLILWKAGRHGEAEAAFDGMVRVIGEHRANHYWAGERFERAGDLRRALDYYRMGLGRDAGETALNLGGLARVHEALGATDSAAAAARAHDARLSTLTEVPLLPGVLAHAGRLDEAIRIARAWADRRVASGNLEGAARSLTQVAELNLRAGLHRDARESATRAERLAVSLTLTDQIVAARRIRGSARIALGETAEGLTELRSAADLAEAHPTATSLFETRLALAEALARTGRAGAALEAYDRAARVVEEIAPGIDGDFDRAGYRERHLAPFDGALQMILDRGGDPPGPVLHWAQRRTAAALALDVRAPERTGRPLSPKEIQGRLAPDEALVHYLNVGGSIFVAVARRDSIRVVRLRADPDSVAALAERLLRPMAATRGGTLDLARASFDVRAAHRLYRILVGPIEPLLVGADRLLVVPDGPIHRVPFEALVDRPSREQPALVAGYLDVGYLIDRWEVLYLPSAQMLAPTIRRRVAFDRTGRVLVLAYRAPAAGREAGLIRAVWGAPRVDVRTGPAATETSARRSGDRYAVLHLAVHATVDDAAPTGSHLSLAPDGRNDGTWRLAEIAGEPATTPLVVLSACETLSGPLYRGEGLMGLSRAFLARGARTVVATRWPIGPPTADLVGAFYRELVAGADPATALRTARLALRRDPATSHPFFWGAFVLVEGR